MDVPRMTLPPMDRRSSGRPPRRPHRRQPNCADAQPDGCAIRSGPCTPGTSPTPPPGPRCGAGSPSPAAPTGAPPSSSPTRGRASTTTSGPGRPAGRAGYVALAMDYHGEGRWIADRAEMAARLAELGADPDDGGAGPGGARHAPRRAHADPSRVAAIGYCFGGAMALELARDGADLKAVVGFHPGLDHHPPRGVRAITGKVLVCVGTEDPFIPLEHRLAFEQEMRAAGVDWRMHLLGGAEHSFTHPAAVPAARTCRASDTTGRARTARGGPCSTSSTRCSGRTARRDRTQRDVSRAATRGRGR